MAVSGRELTNQMWKSRTEKRLEILPEFVTDYYIYLSGKSEKTKYEYIETTKNILEYLKTCRDSHNQIIGEITDETIYKLADIPPRVLRSYFYSYLPEEKHLSKITCATYYSAVRSFFRYLISDDVVEGLYSNPMDKVERPIDDKDREPISLTKEEICLIMENIDNYRYKARNNICREALRTRDKTIVHLCLTTGMRVGTLVEINLEDVDFSQNIIKVISKGGREQVFYLTESTLTLIEKWIDLRNVLLKGEESALFVRYDGGRLSARAVNQMLKKVTKEIDKPITPHKLRSTCATTMYEKTGDIYEVADFLGHKQVTTTQRYITKNKEKRKKGSNILEDAFGF